MMSTINNTSSKKQFYSYLKQRLPELAQLKQQSDKSSFNKLITNILPSIKLYIGRQFNRALKNGSIPPGKYEVADIFDELYINVYDHILEVKEDENLYNWMFKRADKLLEDIIIEEGFDNFFFENIDNYSKLEWDEMEEKFGIDADGELMMEEELDDLSYQKNDYELKDIFVERKEEKLIEQLDKKLTREKIHRHIELILGRLPLLMRTIFDLSVNQQFNEEEIADVKNMEVREVEQNLAKARRYLSISLERRYLDSNN